MNSSRPSDTPDTLRPGYYVCVQPHYVPLLRYRDTWHWLEENARVSVQDPRTLGYTIHSLEGLLALANYTESLIEQRDAMALEAERLQRELDRINGNAPQGEEKP